MIPLLAAVAMLRGGPVAFVGIDASGSAREFQTAFLRRLRDLDESLPPDAALEIYRFDTQTYEIHVGAPLEAKPLLQRVRAATGVDRGQRGTNVLSLARRIDSRLSLYAGRPVTVLVLTDCGVEDMTAKQHAEVRQIAARWARIGIGKVTFSGVRPMNREALRGDFAPLGARVEFESRRPLADVARGRRCLREGGTAPTLRLRRSRRAREPSRRGRWGRTRRG